MDGEDSLSVPSKLWAALVQSAKKSSDVAYEVDMQTLGLRDEAFSVVGRIASGDRQFMFGNAEFQSALKTSASRLMEKWAPVPPASSDGSAAPPPSPPTLHDPAFIRAADALLVCIIFLREFASKDEVWAGLAACDREAIRLLCAKCCFPVRFPVGPHARRVGESVVHVSLVDAAKAGDTMAQACLRKLILASYEFCRLLRLADASPDSELAKQLSTIDGGGLVGQRRYFKFHGKEFKTLLRNKKNREPGQIGFILGELRNAVMEAKRYTLVLMGFCNGTEPDIASLTILVGDAIAQLEHFDVMCLYQLLMMLTVGLPVRAARTVDAASGLRYEEVLSNITAATGDVVRQDVGQADGRRVSRFHARLYAGMSLALLRSSPTTPGGAVPEGHRCLPASGGGDADVVPAGTLHCVAPQGVHWGAGKASWPSTDETSLRHALAAHYEFAGFDDVVAAVLNNPFPPRMIAFTTADLDGVRGLTLASVDNSYSTQNRLDAVMHRLGLWSALVRFYLLARARGHGNLPSFCEGSREAAGRALLALTPAEAAASALAEHTPADTISRLPPAAAAVAEAFPAAMTGGKPQSIIAGKGLAIIRAVEEALAAGEDADAAAQAAAAKLVSE